MRCGYDEITAVLKISKRNFIVQLDRQPRLRRVVEEGRDYGCASIRRAQFKLLNDGNATMAIWLGKQYLGRVFRTILCHESAATATIDGSARYTADRDMLSRSISAIVLLISAVTAQGLFSTGAREPSYATGQEATEAEEYLKAHPEDRTVVKRLLDYYVQRWQNTQADRLRVVLWTIENHPGIDLDGVHDSRGLLLNPDDREGYQKARQLWLQQVRRYPGDPRVLENAAVCLKFTDRESAAGWLKQAMSLNPIRRGSILMALADVYAAAIAGVSGANPWEGPTSVDPAESGSAFALQARLAAAEDAELAGRTGWALYLTTEAFHRLKVSDADYDAIAEELLLQSAALDYPKPARLPFLGVFYERQERKHSGQIHPKSRTEVVAPDEQGKRLLSKTTSIGVTGENTMTGRVHVVVDVIVGTDGHVWKAVAKNVPSELVASAASAAIKSWIYQPLESQGEPVQVATTVDVTVDVRP